MTCHRLDGPLLQTPNGNIPLGTASNCAAGKTPWGTYLTCEEKRHPGNGDPSLTNVPANDGVSIPRDATLVARRKDGGIVGS